MNMHRHHWLDYWRGLAARHAALPALEADDLGAPLTYADMLALVEQLAQGLAAREVGPGTVAVTRLANDSWAMLVHVALLVRGACEVPLPADTSDAELVRLVAEAGASSVIATQVPESGLPAHVSCACRPQALAAPPADAATAEFADKDIASLPGRALPSSGTTGLPRLSVYTHAARWRAHRLQCRLLPHRPGPGEPLLLATPFSHGASLLALAWWHAGGRVVLYPGADAGHMLMRLMAEPCTLFAPPTVMRKLLDAAPAHPVPARLVFTGTQQLDAATYARARALFGPVVRVTYGKSECINPVCFLQPTQTDAVYAGEVPAGQACVGRPAPGVEIQVRDDEGRVLPPGAAGHVFLRARHMSAGQWRDARLVPWPEGWHDTSDRGYLDEAGRLWLLGRRGDVVKSGGYLVALEAVDAILRELEPEHDCAALAIPSGYWGAVVVAVTTGPADRLRARLSAGFAAHPRAMRPRLVLAVDRLPRNAQGKLMRPRLLESILASHALQDGAYPELLPV